MPEKRWHSLPGEKNIWALHNFFKSIHTSSLKFGATPVKQWTKLHNRSLRNIGCRTLKTRITSKIFLRTSFVSSQLILKTLNFRRKTVVVERNGRYLMFLFHPSNNYDIKTLESFLQWNKCRKLDYKNLNYRRIIIRQ